MRLYAAILPLVTALLAGCATGTDSTRRITASDVRREVGRVSPEDTFLTAIRSLPPSRWMPGHRLRITDERFKLLLGNTAPADSLTGRDVEFMGLRPHLTPMGDTATILTFSGPGGAIMDLTLPQSPAAVDADTKLSIPYAIDLDVVQRVRERLLDNTYYILTADRFTTDGNNTRRRKFIPVRIAAVEPGNSLYPVRLLLQEPDGARSMIYLTPWRGATRTFGTQLALADPRSRYPKIPAAVWDNIMANRVDEGMTRDECRLAIGAPVSIDRQNTNSYILERWTYENGRFLVFEDGILRRFRK